MEIGETERQEQAVHPLAEEFPALRERPSLQRQVGMALLVLAMGPDGVGRATQDKLMWPYTEYSEEDVRRAAFKLLASVHTALLEALPPARIERISTDQAAYLSFALGDGSLDGSSPSPAGGSPGPA